MVITLIRFLECDGPGSWEKLRIENAQPREFMGAGLMRDILHGSPWATREGDVLTIWDDFGHRYVYLVGEYDYERDGYELEWPD